MTQPGYFIAYGLVDQMLAGLAPGHTVYVNAFVRSESDSAHTGQHSIGRDMHKLSVQAITPPQTWTVDRGPSHFAEHSVHGLRSTARAAA